MVKNIKNHSTTSLKYNKLDIIIGGQSNNISKLMESNSIGHELNDNSDLIIFSIIFNNKLQNRNICEEIGKRYIDIIMNYKIKWKTYGEFTVFYGLHKNVTEYTFKNKADLKFIKKYCVIFEIFFNDKIVDFDNLWNIIHNWECKIENCVKNKKCVNKSFIKYTLPRIFQKKIRINDVYNGIEYFTNHVVNYMMVNGYYILYAYNIDLSENIFAIFKDNNCIAVKDFNHTLDNYRNGSKSK